MLETDDGRCITLDPVYFAEHAAVGPLFAVAGSITNRARSNECFRDFGFAFELYCSATLRTMYPKPPHPLLDRLVISPETHRGRKEKHQLSDAALFDERTVALFEMKAQWIPDWSVESSEPDDYLKVLRSKVVKSADNGRPKGVGQLASSISKLASDEWTPNEFSVSDVDYILPVLVTYDSLLQSGTHSWFLAEEFKTALAPDSHLPSGDMLKGSLRVGGLIVLPIDVLENVQTSVEEFAFVDALREYARSNPDRVRSFHTFLATSRFRHRLLANRHLATSAINALNNARNAMLADARDQSTA